MTNTIETIHDYSRLDPDAVINAVESKGYLKYKDLIEYSRKYGIYN